MSEEQTAKVTPDHDYSTIFIDPEFTEKYPEIKAPPPTFVAHQGKIISFESGKNIAVVFPVGEMQTNPVGTLQGGILTSFFDDAFGILCMVSLHKPCVTIDMTVNFIRPVKPGSFVVIRAEFKARGKRLLQLSAEAVNSKEKLVATVTSNWLVYESSPRA
ncbi:MAG: PaaI family thioesterase [Desulfobulbaceae bacterium]|nr:PaaI family thioesterase [Desulfobulbaceae bacterium]